MVVVPMAFLDNVVVWPKDVRAKRKQWERKLMKDARPQKPKKGDWEDEHYRKVKC